MVYVRSVMKYIKTALPVTIPKEPASTARLAGT